MKNSNWWVADPEVVFNPVVAEFYDLFAWPFVSITTAKMIEELKGVTGEILEIGCGTGLATAQLAKIGKVTAVEPSRYMLKKANDRIQNLNLEGRVRFLTDRAESLPVESNRFNAVIISYVLRHIKPEILDTVAQEINRVTFPGAKVLIADLNLPFTGAFPKGIIKKNPNYTILGVLSIYDPSSLAGYLGDYGLRLKSIHYYPMSFLLVLDKP